MQIAVAGMEDVGDPEAVLLRHLGHAPQHQRQLLPGYGAVHAVVIGADPAHRRKGRLAPGPKLQPLGLALTDPDILGTAGLGDAAHRLDQVRDFRLGSVQLDDQQALDIQRIAGVAEGLGGVNGVAVHHLQPARDDAGADDPGNASPGVFVRRKTDQHRRRRLRLAQNAHGDLGNHAQQALGAGHQAHQVIAMRIQMLAAETQYLAVHQHHFEAEDVVGGEAVFQAVHAARVLGHVAADGAGDLARRIGGVVEAGPLHRLGDAKVGDPRLSADGAVLVVDLQDAVELAEPEHDAVGERQGAARERGPGPARHHLDAAPVAQTEDRRDLGRGLRQHDQERPLPVGGQAVGFVSPKLVLGDDDAVRLNDGMQVLDQRLALLQNGGFGHRHLHGASLTDPQPPRIHVTVHRRAAARTRKCKRPRPGRGPFVPRERDLSPGAPCSAGWSCR